MTEFKSKRCILSAKMTVPFTAAQIWPLLCPVREHDWIPNWDSQLIFSQSGFNELGCVFKTDYPTEGGPEIWITSGFDPPVGLDFVRTSAHLIIRYTITLHESQEDTEVATQSAINTITQIIWQQEITSLSATGNEILKDKNPKRFSSQINDLEKMLVHYLKTGQRLIQ